MRPDPTAARTTRPEESLLSQKATGAWLSAWNPGDDESAFSGSATTAWVGFQAVVVVVRVLVVVGLWLGLFLAVFLGYVTLPLIAPAVLGVGYVVVQIGRKVLRSR
jgi:hypothetical protein